MTGLRASRTPVVRRFMAAAGLIAVLAALLPVVTVSAATDRLPDLRVATITDFHIVNSGGRRLLRFTGMMWNQGDGPLEVRSNRPSTSTSTWDVDQIIYTSTGSFRRRETPATLKYAGDGHDHWHVRSMLTYHLWGSTGTLRDAKIGFCFFDTNLINGSLARSPSSRVYTESMCGKRSSTSTRNGISVGWGDKYPWNFAYQWIDITGLPGGTYTLRSAVDLFKFFTEKSETNNCAWARVKFNATGTSISVVSRGQGCINDWSTTSYAADVAWAREAGVSPNCHADMFCTNNPVNRGQAATFVQRAFHYPAATKDYYTDDGSDPNEGNINRIAEAGIAPRCAAGRYCPTRVLITGHIAYMLSRALALPPPTQDWFDDDDGNGWEDSINRLAEAGILTGCGERRSCPTQVVTRGRLMALLHRSLEAPAP